MPGRHRIELSRRDFLRRVGGAAIATPTLAAILAACSKPGETPSGEGTTASRVLAKPDNPVTLPLNGTPIAADTPIETGATLKVYNWDAYMYKKVLKDFEAKFDCTVEWTTFNNMEEGIQKITSGQVTPDVFFPTVDYVARLVEADLLQPLQHELIPNMEANVWQSFWDPGPWYDVGWQYSVPYTIYTTGVGYRRDRISDDEAAGEGYDMLWNPEYTGAISYYDSYRDAIGMALLRNGGTNPDSSDPTEVAAAADSILEILNELNGRLTINGAYAKLPEGEFTVAQAWSGDMVGAKWYLPKGTDVDVLGYWYPEDHKGLIGNDTIVIPSTSASPRLAHEFLNFFLDADAGYTNFADWNGYQPPFTSIDPGRLVDENVVPETLSAAVVTEDMFTQGYIQAELPPEVDQIWADEWARVQAGG
jgi:spermidine/putrescine transport system substrate-binding protein